MKQTIKHQYFFPHAPKTVWEYLTNSDLMALWLMKNNFQPEQGAEFQFRTGPIPGLNFDGIFYCKVLEITPFTQLSYSWGSGPGEGKITLDSVVLWQLQPKDNGTALLLEHSGFEKPENYDFYSGLNHGWIEKFQNIEKLLASAKHDTANA
jgi:uncharacterized protein YndB with AHSA1/START domain